MFFFVINSFFNVTICGGNKLKSFNFFSLLTVPNVTNALPTEIPMCTNTATKNSGDAN